MAAKHSNTVLNIDLHPRRYNTTTLEPGGWGIMYTHTTPACTNMVLHVKSRLHDGWNSVLKINTCEVCTSTSDID